MRQRFTGSLVLLIAIAAQSRADYLMHDYLVAPSPPHMQQDANTTFLADFSKGRLHADSSAGDAAILCDRPVFVPGGGLKGSFRLAVPGNFDPRSWTVELLARVPADQNQALPFCSCRGKSGWTMALSVGGPHGVGLRLEGRPQAGQLYPFALEAAAGGNGATLANTAPNQWVYMALGVDLAQRRAAAVVRDLEGHILRQKMEFAGRWSFRNDFAKDMSDSQRTAAINRCWDEMAKALGKDLPATLALGHDAVEIARLRISRGLRDGLLLRPLPYRVPPENALAIYRPAELDPARAVTRKITRLLGYPGYQNRQATEIDEAFLPMKAGDPPLTVALKNMQPGLYSFFLYGTIASQGRTRLDQVWKPCPMEFELRDRRSRLMANGRMLLKQWLVPRRMQGFHFHVSEAGDYTATFRLSPRALETAEILSVYLVDQLAGLPDVAIKQSQNLVPGKTSQLDRLSEERRRRDDLIWAALPPLNVHLQVHGQVKQFLQPPAGANLDKWDTGSMAGMPGHYRPKHTFSPLDFVNLRTKETLPQDKVLAGAAWPGEHADDGTGIYLTRRDFSELATDIYYTPRAILLGERFLLYAGAILDSGGSFGGLKLAKAYHEQGDPQVGHDGAMALVRFAYDWPALEMTLHEIRLCTHSPDFEYGNWQEGRNGKFFYRGWSGTNFVGLLTAYDQLFPYIRGNQVFADAVHRFIPWIKTPEDVLRMLDRYLVFAGVRDFNRGLIGAAPVEDVAGQVLGPHALTAPWFDLTKAMFETYPAKGTYQEMYATAMPRTGTYYIGSFLCYAYGAAQDTVKKAGIMAAVKAKGIQPKMDLSDVQRYPKVRAAADFVLDIFTAGGYPITIGDASGSTHTTRYAERNLALARETSETAFRLCGHPRHAWLLKNLHGSQDPAVTRAAQEVPNPLVHQFSRVVPNEVAVIEMGTQRTDLSKKGSATLRVGIGGGHAHHDQLDLNLFAMGLPLAVDLACRDEGNHWSYPPARCAYLHNMAIASQDLDPKPAFARTGEPWLRAFQPPLVRASYVNQDGSQQLDRDVLLMEIGDTGDFYAFDVQRIRGGKLHTWCFHGCESDDLELNVPMAPAEDHRWLSRPLAGTRKAGKSGPQLEAIWTMTRQGREIPHKFKGGGTIKTAACEQAALVSLYDPRLGQVHVRATLLGRPGDDVLQANPYSEPYGYCFPFLWVQSPAGNGPSVYPAVYDWWRGNQPLLAKIELLQSEPLVVRVTTRSGQIDTFMAGPAGFLAVSRDARGLRWARLSGAREMSADGLAIRADVDEYTPKITEIDYARRTLVTSSPLPPDPYVSIGNPMRRSNVALRGHGTTFTWDDDLLVHEGKITEVKIPGEDQLALQTNAKLLWGDAGNRKAEGFTLTNEAATWHFRGGRVIKRMPGEKLSQAVFTDVNGDGLVHLKTYEIGIGDQVSLLADVTIRRTPAGYAVETNVPVRATIGDQVLEARR